MTFALLQQAAAGGAPGWTQFVFIGGMALMFYFLLIRPQSKARKEMEARLAKLKAGDEVVLSSGLYRGEGPPHRRRRAGLRSGTQAELISPDLPGRCQCSINWSDPLSVRSAP